MDFKDFTDITFRFWHDFLSYVSEAQAKGLLISTGGTKVLFPNMLLVTNCEGYYSAELLGATPQYAGLSIKKSKTQPVYKYLSQFDDSVKSPAFLMGGKHQGFRNLCLSHDSDAEEVKRRFPSFSTFYSRVVRGGLDDHGNAIDGRGSLIEFDVDFESLYFENCLLVNKKNSVYRCKRMLLVVLVRSSINAGKLKAFYEYLKSQEEIPAVHIVEENEVALVISSQLQNLYLSHGVHETTIGKFISLHPQLICKAFDCSSFLYERSFKWIKTKYPMDEAAINPDLLIKRADDFYDIYDIKTAAFKFKSLTSPKSSRRKFIEYVYDGIAQLYNYRDYFAIPENAEHALEAHGVRVFNPRLVLVVGSWENANPLEIEHASELHKDVTIIDYDTFCHLYVSNSNIK